MKDVKKWAVINSLGTTAYIILIASFIYALNNIDNPGKTVFVPIAMLMLFVFSAAFTGSLVFGRPILLYLDGKKRESLYLLTYTLGILLALTIFVFMFLFFLIR